MALLLHLMLADAAVETFLSGSPVRWWVAGGAIACFVVSAATWRRTTWRMKAWAPGLGLLAILAATAWLAGGLIDGVRMFGLDTGRVLALATAAGVAGAGIALMRVQSVPPSAKWAIGALTAYGALAFVQGGWSGVPFPALLAGQSPWRALPFFLQGGVVGGLIVVPLGLVVSAVSVGLRSPVEGSFAYRARTASALALSLAIILAALPQPNTASGASSVIVATEGPPILTDIAPASGGREPEVPASSADQGSGTLSADLEIGVTLEKYVSAINRLKASIDRSSIDIDAAQARLGGQPEAIVAFVRDRIRYESYVGALRGARGTLLAQAGNAVDRAVLLSALLESAGHKTRFASGQLSLDQAESLMRSTYRPTPLLHDPPGALLEIHRRSAVLFATLAGAYDDAGFGTGTWRADESVWTRSVREAQQHVWVQLATSTGWVELDPSPGVQYGRSLMTALRVTEEIDRTLFHTVEFTIEAEVERNGTRETRRLLHYQTLAADLMGEPIGLFHTRQATDAIPVMVVGKKVISGSPIAAPAQERQGFGQNFGARFSESVLGKPITSPFVSAEWLRIQIAGPSGRRDATYTIFDAFGPAARHGGLLGADLPSATQVGNALDHSFGVAVANGSLPPAMLAALLADLEEPHSPQGAIQLLAMQGAAYFVTRGLLRPRYVDALPLSYLDGPNIVITRLATDEERESDRVAMDLTLKAYRTLRRPDDPLASEGAFYDYLAEGVIDHSVERWVGGGDVDTSVGALFETAAGHGGIRVVRNVNDASLAGLTRDGRLLVSDALAHGHLPILVRERPSGWTGPLGWWTVDPRTGRIEDTNEFGEHQVVAERTPTQNVSTTAAREQSCGLGRAVFAAFLAAALVTSAYNHPDALGFDTSLEDTYEIVDLLCGRGGRKTPKVPASKVVTRHFPPCVTCPLLPRTPKTAPVIDKFFRLRGGMRGWR